jgi:predicted nucleotidyltransferase component of viral defense system
MIEKDYVLGWALSGIAHIPELAFKGGTALAKLYFAGTWRLSEDLDFATDAGVWDEIAGQVPGALSLASEASGLQLAVKSEHANPYYMQFKVQYTGPLGKNWIKIDITPEAPVAGTKLTRLSRVYSDYPDFEVRAEQLEEIFAQKLRALVERKKVRDYYDVWQMSQLDVDRGQVVDLFRRKLEVKQIDWGGVGDFFPPDLVEILKGYWENELGRLVRPVPDMETALSELRHGLDWLNA